VRIRPGEEAAVSSETQAFGLMSGLKAGHARPPDGQRRVPQRATIYHTHYILQNHA
jgi:hypothetical protein